MHPFGLSGLWQWVFAALVLCAAAQAAQAQTGTPPWQARTGDNGSLISGSAYLPDFSLSFGCTAPSPQGLPLVQTGSHESHRNDVFEMLIGFSDHLFEWRDPWRQRGAMLVVGATRYRLDEIALNELQGTALYLPMDAPVIRALFDAPSLALVTPEGVEHRFPVAGLTDALDTALTACIDRWVELGHRPPASLNRGGPAFNTPTAPLPGIPVFNLPAPSAQPDMRATPLPGIPVFDLSGVARAPATAPHVSTIAELPPAIPRHIRDQCGGNARIEDSALTHSADFDGDGLPDHVLNYTGVYCLPENMRGFCGAANCSIQVFMSSMHYRDPVEFLAIALEPATAFGGRAGLRVSATNFICGSGACDGIWVWNGRTFEMQ